MIFFPPTLFQQFIIPKTKIYELDHFISERLKVTYYAGNYEMYSLIQNFTVNYGVNGNCYNLWILHSMATICLKAIEDTYVQYKYTEKAYSYLCINVCRVEPSIHYVIYNANRSTKDILLGYHCRTVVAIVHHAKPHNTKFCVEFALWNMYVCAVIYLRIHYVLTVMNKN